MNRSEAQRVVARRMVGIEFDAATLREACRLLNMKPKTLERCRREAVRVTCPQRDALCETEHQALNVHGMESSSEE